MLVNGTNVDVALFFPFTNEDGLPFLLNLSNEAKSFIALVLVVILIIGIYFRIKIVQFLLKPDNRSNPINYFFLLDQAKWVFSGLNIIFTVVAAVLQFPLSDVIGYEHCKWVDIFGSVYLYSSTIWSCNMAIIRDHKT